PCQNSTVSGTTRSPPQCGGAGTSPGNRSAAAAYAASSCRRELSTRDCGLAQAPSWAPRGRRAKYASTSGRGTCCTLPHTTTCRCSGGQWKTRLAYGLASASVALRDRRLVKHTKPRWSYALSSTVRALGRPVGSAVASTIAFGSGTPPATASASQAANCAGQSGARSASTSGWAG